MSILITLKVKHSGFTWTSLKFLYIFNTWH